MCESAYSSKEQPSYDQAAARLRRRPYKSEITSAIWFPEGYTRRGIEIVSTI
jgi:hypothetical protein